MIRKVHYDLVAAGYIWRRGVAWQVAIVEDTAKCFICTAEFVIPASIYG